MKNNNQPQDTPKPEEGWEKELRILGTVYDNWTLKNFIRNLLAQERATWCKEHKTYCDKH